MIRLIHVHDVTEPLSEHDRIGGLLAMHDAAPVDLQYVIPVFEFELPGLPTIPITAILKTLSWRPPPWDVFWTSRFVAVAGFLRNSAGSRRRC